MCIGRVNDFLHWNPATKSAQNFPFPPSAQGREVALIAAARNRPPATSRGAPTSTSVPPATALVMLGVTMLLGHRLLLHRTHRVHVVLVWVMLLRLLRLRLLLNGHHIRLLLVLLLRLLVLLGKLRWLNAVPNCHALRTRVLRVVAVRAESNNRQRE